MTTAAAIIIGDEILSAKVRDANTPLLIDLMAELGVDLQQGVQGAVLQPGVVVQQQDPVVARSLGVLQASVRGHREATSRASGVVLDVDRPALDAGEGSLKEVPPLAVRDDHHHAHSSVSSSPASDPFSAPPHRQLKLQLQSELQL